MIITATAPAERWGQSMIKYGQVILTDISEF